VTVRGWASGYWPDPRVSGVAFTGSNETAAIIHRTLAERKGAIVPFIAETGGINAMIVDSSALPEQAVRDVVLSAFDSAGQRCSAARLLFVQEDIADKLIVMLNGAIAELKVGDPANYATDVGPVIDEDARRNLDAHKDKMRREAADDRRPRTHTGHGRRHLRGAGGLRDRGHIGAGARGLRAHPARGALSLRPAPRGLRGDQRHRVRADAWDCTHGSSAP
jgi:acyl-CoA reductase-like NAD-dependent aldehyde dehydrogenase